jgi:single-strand DNA-binding protein
MVVVKGSIRTGKYENQEGRTVYTTEVEAERVQLLLSKRRPSEGNEEEGNEGPGNEGSGVAGSGAKKEEDPFSREGTTVDLSDDDLPF